jgi:hypothetical protein
MLYEESGHRLRSRNVQASWAAEYTAAAAVTSEPIRRTRFV